MENKTTDCDRFVLFAKQPGRTSFSSLYTIKHALNTLKVGHTGTLDSFAQGLLVVCCGSLTRLAGRITEFDKEYEAVIRFGEETDTLECTGNIIKRAELPDENAVRNAVEHFRGKINQTPPAFSAIHVDGKRASDLAREGKTAEIPSREITVFSSDIKELKKNEDGKVLYARVCFHVSKGTYIRSLARDIGEYCGSAAHLTGLLRTKIGSFRLENAAGYDRLEPFTIDNASAAAEKLFEEEQKRKLEKEALKTEYKKEKKNGKKAEKPVTPEEEDLRRQSAEKSVPLNEELAALCGFASLYLKKESEERFYNGGTLASAMFTVSPFTLKEEYAAVFLQDGKFAGLLQKDSNGYFKYSFVVH